MLSGFNTDVERSGTILHVQTEDKGLSAAMVESLVYLGGQILASRRTSYRDLVDEGKGRKELLEVMDTQHRGLIEEIREGAFDAKLPGGEVAEEPSQEVQEPVAEVEVDPSAEPEQQAADPEIQDLERTQFVAQDAPVAEAKQTPVESAGEDQPLDEMVLDYLAIEQEQEGLELAIENEVDLELGLDASVRLLSRTRKSKEVLESVAIAVKMISSVSEPMTLTEGLTDGRGLVDLKFRVPNLRRGSGALIITGHCELGTADIKRLL